MKPVRKFAVSCSMGIAMLAGQVVRAAPGHDHAIAGDEVITAVLSMGVPARGPASARGPEAEDPFERLVIRNVHVIDGTGSPANGPVNITIERDRIVAINDIGGTPIHIHGGQLTDTERNYTIVASKAKDRPRNALRECGLGGVELPEDGDAALMLHKGKIAFERYGGVMNKDRPHLAFSVTKSYFGMLAEMLIADCRLDEGATVATYVPELAQSGECKF